jgi:hypothetical protein
MPPDGYTLLLVNSRAEGQRQRLCARRLHGRGDCAAQDGGGAAESNNAKIDFALMMGRGMPRTEKTEALRRTINAKVAAAVRMNRKAALQAEQRARSRRHRRRDA